MTREPTPIDAIANAHTTRLAELSPIEATFCGITGYDHLLPDLSPRRHRRPNAARPRHSRRPGDRRPVDDVDAVTLAAMNDRLGLAVELDEAGALLPDLNVIASPLQYLRDVLDLMPTATEADWSAIASRLSGIPDAITGYIASLREGARRAWCPHDCRWRKASTRPASWPTPVPPSSSPSRPGRPTSRPRCSGTSRQARPLPPTHMRGSPRFLSDELAAQAPASDGIGRERYALWSREFIGAAVDLDETYEWGLAELDRMTREQESIAVQIAGPGAPPSPRRSRNSTAIPRSSCHGKQALQGVDAGEGGRSDRRARRRPFRHPGAGPANRSA